MEPRSSSVDEMLSTIVEILSEKKKGCKPKKQQYKVENRKDYSSSSRSRTPWPQTEKHETKLRTVTLKDANFALYLLRVEVCTGPFAISKSQKLPGMKSVTQLSENQWDRCLIGNEQVSKNPYGNALPSCGVYINRRSPYSFNLDTDCRLSNQ